MPSPATASTAPLAPTAPTASQPQLLEGGEGFFPALVAALDAARDWVQLETYIFDFHGRGADVAEALMRAARRGVTVQVLVDGIGSAHLEDQAEPLDADKRNVFAVELAAAHERDGPARLQAAGVQWLRYSPLTGRWPTLGILHPDQWRRLHRKLCVIDQQQVFCGGINILDDFHDPNHGPLSAPRFDFTVAVHGPAAAVASEAMALLWWRVQAGYSAQQRHLTEAWEAFKTAGFGGRLRGLQAASARAKANGSQRTTAALLLRDNFLNRNTIERAYRRAIGQSRQEILIANAYFLPGGRLRRALIKAARRGVKVTLLLQGKYEYFMQYHAARPVYGALLKAGVEIHEYEASFLHAKVAVVDGHWATVGSSNLDPLSLLLAREANVVIDDRAFAAALRERLCEAIEGHGRRMDESAFANRPWRQRLLDQLAYALMRLALLLTRHRY